MSSTIEEQLRHHADAVDQQLRRRPIPPFAEGSVRRPRRVAPYAAAALVAAASVAVVVVVGGRDGRGETVVPSAETSTVESTGLVPDLSSSVPSTSAGGSLETTVPVLQPSIGVPLETVDDAGAPAALGVLPDGYRPILVQESSPATPDASRWLSSFVRRPADGELADYLQVQIVPAEGVDPYAWYPGLAANPDVVMGSFTGKVAELAPGYLTFATGLPNGNRLMVGGRAPIEEIEALVEGLDLTHDPISAVATVLPDGYELVGEGPTSGDNPRRWSISYARDQLMQSMITVDTRLDPYSSALADLIGPSVASIVDINGHVGVLTDQGLTFDVSPNYQIFVGREAPSEETSAGQVDDEEMIRLARSVVAISNDEYAKLAELAEQQPLTPTDQTCSFYIATGDMTSDQATTAPEGMEFALEAPGTLQLTLSTQQPLKDVELGIRTAMDTTVTPLVTIDHLDDPTTVTITWDGNIGGQPAPPGTYMLSTSASPQLASESSCAPDGDVQPRAIAFIVE